MHGYQLTTALLISMLLLPAGVALASPQHDQYYSDDIFTAIEEARQRTHHYNYSRAKRYNRSTSQSIQIPRLLNTEMDEHIVEGAIQASASGSQQISGQNQFNQKTTSAARSGKALNEGTPEQVVPAAPLLTPASGFVLNIEANADNVVRDISYTGQDYIGSTRDIRADVSVSATPRP
ncbi:hypothetical protein [Bacterioplanoides sp.]|uniref:hypothetical protein n=1 Tax=Bacterioplanoides sp. TaxID=2066072 RepID=UPI003AFFDE9A